MKVHANDPGRNRLLAAIPAPDFALLAPHLRDVTLDQGDLLLQPGDEIKDVYFPITAMISILAIVTDGRVIEIATVGREGALGALRGPRSTPLRRSSTRAVVQVPGIALRIATFHYQQAVRQSDPIQDLIVLYNEALMAQMQQTAACNALHAIKSRLSRLLLQTRDHMDNDMFPLTQQLLAQMLGVRRTSVTWAARTLQKEGLISCHRGHVKIIDVEGLNETACECYAAIRQQIQEAIPDVTD